MMVDLWVDYTWIPCRLYIEEEMKVETDDMVDRPAGGAADEVVTLDDLLLCPLSGWLAGLTSQILNIRSSVIGLTYIFVINCSNYG